MRPLVELDFSRTVVLAAQLPEVEAFATRLAERGQLAGVAFEHRSRGLVLRMWRRRVRRNGLLATLSQLAALLLDRLIAHTTSNATPSTPHLAAELVAHFTSANDPRATAWIVSRRPSVVVVVGTSILTANTLAALNACPLINMHAGMTPRYRGTHGGAWAIIEGRPEEACSTWHLVDAGIDTGVPLAYVPVRPARTLTELAHHHRADAFEWLAEMATNGVLHADPPPAPTRAPLRYPPGIAAWLAFRRATRHLP